MSSLKGVKTEFNNLHAKYPVTCPGLTGSQVIITQVKAMEKEAVTDNRIWVKPIQSMTNKAHAARLFGEWLCKMHIHGLKYYPSASCRVIDILTFLILAGGEGLKCPLAPRDSTNNRRKK
jgi:hypothetical protein